MEQTEQSVEFANSQSQSTPQQSQKQPLHRALSRLKGQNDKLRKELQQLSNALDNALSKRKIQEGKSERANTRDRELQNSLAQIELYQKEVASLKQQAAQGSFERKLKLEENVLDLQSKIKEIQQNNRNLQLKVNEQGKKLHQLNNDPEQVRDYKKLSEELRVVREKCKELENRYSNQTSQDKRATEKYQELEQAARKLGIDPDNLYPRQSGSKQHLQHLPGVDDEPQLAPADNTDIRGIHNQIQELEKEKRIQSAQLRKSTQVIEEQLEIAGKENQGLESKIKELTHQCRLKDMQIKQLRRQIRAEQMKASAPDLSLDQKQEDEAQEISLATSNQSPSQQRIPRVPPSIKDVTQPKPVAKQPQQLPSSENTPNQQPIQRKITKIVPNQRPQFGQIRGIEQVHSVEINEDFEPSIDQTPIPIHQAPTTQKSNESPIRQIEPKNLPSKEENKEETKAVKENFGLSKTDKAQEAQSINTIGSDKKAKRQIEEGEGREDLKKQDSIQQPEPLKKTSIPGPSTIPTTKSSIQAPKKVLEPPNIQDDDIDNEQVDFKDSQHDSYDENDDLSPL